MQESSGDVVVTPETLHMGVQSAEAQIGLEGKMVTLQWLDGELDVMATGLVVLMRDGAVRMINATLVVKNWPIHEIIKEQPLEQYLVCLFCLQPMQCITREGIIPQLWQCNNGACEHKGDTYQSN